MSDKYIEKIVEVAKDAIDNGKYRLAGSKFINLARYAVVIENKPLIFLSSEFQLPDGYYILGVEVCDMSGFTSTTIFSFSIRNWALLKLLPATERNIAGRTMPVKFSLRVVEAVDPEMPFIINQELEIIIYEESNPNKILQRSKYGDTSIDYRIDEIGELYITNFRTSKTTAVYVVEIYRGDFLIGSFTFQTYSSKKNIESTQVLRFQHFQIFPEFIQGMNLIFQLVGISYLLIISKKKLIC